MHIFKLLLVFFLAVQAVCAESPVKRLVLEREDGSAQAFTPETSPPQPTPARTNWGINLADHRYYSAERPFTNLAMQASTWQWSMSSGGWNNAAPGPVDANGYPVSVPAGVFAGIVLDMHQGLPNAAYQVSPADVLTVDGGVAGRFIKPGDPYRMLVRVRAGLNSLTIKEADSTVTDTFWPPFVDRTKRFGVIRFMNWCQVNDSRQVSWGTRTKPTSYTQGENEVAYELQLQLMEACASDGWLCVHHTADDSYVRSLARLCRGKLPKGSTLYLEHSNEVWNWIFPQARYCADRSPITRSPIEYHITRTARIADIFREEGVEVVSVLGAQAVGSGHFDWVLSKLGPLPPSIDAIAIAPYFGFSVTTAQKSSGVDSILAQCDVEIDQQREFIKQWKILCDRYKLRLIAYEGGQHVVASGLEQNDPRVVQNIIEANRSPRMGTLYKRYMALWDEVTNHEVHCLFNSVYPPSKHGCWGLQEYEGQTSAVKYRAVMDYLGLSP